jgi:hypothetical protein
MKKSIKIRRVPCKYERALKNLVGATLVFIQEVDVAYADPELIASNTRGQRIAALVTALEVEIDKVRYHTFDLDFRKDSPARKDMERKHWKRKQL